MLNSGTKDQFHQKQNQRRQIEMKIAALENNLLVTEGEMKRLKLDQGRVHSYMLQSMSKLKSKANSSIAIEIGNLQSQIRNQEAVVKRCDLEIKKHRQEIDKLNSAIQHHEKAISEAQQEMQKGTIEMDKIKKQIMEDKNAQSEQRELLQHQQRLKQNQSDASVFERKSSNIRNEIQRLKNELQKYT